MGKTVLTRAGRHGDLAVPAGPARAPGGEGRRTLRRGLGCVLAGAVLASPGCVLDRRVVVPATNEIVIWGYRGDAFYGVVTTGSLDHLAYVRSGDGGATWTRVDARPEGDMPIDFYSAIEKCAPDGVCYRYNQEGFVIERGNADEGWTVELTVPGPDELECLDVNPEDSEQAVVQVSDTAVAYRRPNGTWRTVDVVAATR